MKRNEVIEGLRDPKDNPCWKGYKPVGTKQKNGKTVPNCVPKEEVDPGINKDKETKFHSKLDKLVHNTFGKRDDEVEEAGFVDVSGWSDRAIQRLGHADDYDRPIRPQIVKIYFFDIPPEEFENAQIYGMKKFKSGKFGIPVYDKSGASTTFRINGAAKKYGKPRLWTPKNESVQESKTTVKVPVTQKPRQGALKTQTGAGAHRDKKKEQKQGKEKHRKPFAEQSNYTADEMVDILSGKKTQAQVDAERKAKPQTAPVGGAAQLRKDVKDAGKEIYPPATAKPAKEAAGELKVQKDDDKSTVLLNPATGVQTQIDKTNPNSPRLTQDETGKLKLTTPQSTQQGGMAQKPNLTGKSVAIDTSPLEDISSGDMGSRRGDDPINPHSVIGGDEEHDEVTRLLVKKLQKLAGL